MSNNFILNSNKLYLKYFTLIIKYQMVLNYVRLYKWAATLKFVPFKTKLNTTNTSNL